ncbi:MAG: adenylate kinase [Candidatus Fonsibacter sp.]|nr:adenylate kinase [Candidatus Fonsibacter sp.]
MNLVIFGPPGAGKGTQSAKLVKEFNLFQLSTGDLLRDEVSKKNEFGNKIDEILKSGELVSDEIINNLIENKISNPQYKNQIIFDGFPRNLEQAKSLDNLLKKYNQEISLVINLKVDNRILVKRITCRVTCSLCSKTFNTFFDPPKTCELKGCEQRKLNKRSDDNETTIVKRLKTYDEKTFPVLDYYQKKGIMKNIDGMQEISAISEQLFTLIQGIRS